jgi:hypothetical protein
MLPPVYKHVKKNYMAGLQVFREMRDSRNAQGIGGVPPRRGESSHGAQRRGRSDSGAPQSPVSGVLRRKCAQIFKKIFVLFNCRTEKLY